MRWSLAQIDVYSISGDVVCFADVCRKTKAVRRCCSLI